jgi:hypothetical protein
MKTWSDQISNGMVDVGAAARMAALVDSWDIVKPSTEEGEGER